MATNSMGKGVVMVGVPMHVTDSKRLGRKALELDRSKASIARDLVRAFLDGKISLPVVAVFFAAFFALKSEMNPKMYVLDGVDTDVRRVRTLKGKRRGKDDVIVWDEE